MYKLLKDPYTNEVCKVIRLDGHLFVPFDPDNTDYQAYLEWLAEGNTPLPADEGAI
jgi:hypothetical protein